MRREYLENIKVINNSIEDFNKLLNPNNHVPNINIDKLEDETYCTSLMNKSWEELRFPLSAEKKGIYFIFGYNPEEKTKYVTYIGKASNPTSTIGKRLHSHLLKYKNHNSYLMNDAVGNPHILEYVLGVELESVGLNLLSSSLEEYLIQNVRDHIKLLNATGN